MMGKKITHEGEVIDLDDRELTTEVNARYPIPTSQKGHKLKAWGNYDTDAESDATGFKPIGATLTDQSQKDETDINLMIERFGVLGTAERASIKVPPMHQDFAEGVTDFQTAMNTIREAQEAFNALDAHSRARFNNDPGMFIEHMEQVLSAAESKRRDRQIDELIEMGLAMPRETPPVVSPEPPATPVAGDPPSKEKKGEKAEK